MGKDPKQDIARLRRECLALEQALQEQKECLSKTINVLCVLAARDTSLSEEIDAIRGMVNAPDPLPLRSIEAATSGLKDKILAKGTESPVEKENEAAPSNTEDLLEVCKAIRRLMAVLLEGFYPLTRELEGRASSIHLDCRKIEDIHLKQETEALLEFLEDLKKKIATDFKYINQAFFTLLDKVKDLEKTFSGQQEDREEIERIEYFEMKIHGEMSSIVNSFDIHMAIDEIKKVVIRKIQNIKQLVSQRKVEDLKRAEKARVNMKILRDRIAEATKQAREMSKQAEEFKMVAMKDGPTGLYNRSAFDMRMEDAIRRLGESGEFFTLILLDVDRFKEINDTFGHVAGDKVLEKVAQSFRETFREDDFMARYGGDEFAVIVENMTDRIARQRLSIFRKNLAMKRFVSYKKGRIDITVSAGVAEAQPGDSAQSILDRADQAMYTEKQGRKLRA